MLLSGQNTHTKFRQIFSATIILFCKKNQIVSAIWQIKGVNYSWEESNVFAETRYFFCFLIDYVVTSDFYDPWLNNLNFFYFWQKGQVPCVLCPHVLTQ